MVVNEWYHTPGQSPGPGVAQATPCSAAEPRGMKPCFPGTRSEIPESISLATFGNQDHSLFTLYEGDYVIRRLSANKTESSGVIR